MACAIVGKWLVNIVADAPMGRADIAVRRLVCRMGDDVERVLRRALC